MATTLTRIASSAIASSMRDLTVENTYGGSGPKIALRTLGARPTLTNVVIRGDHYIQ